MTSRTCSLTDRWLVSVTPSTLIEVTLQMSGSRGGAVNCLHVLHCSESLELFA